MAEAEEAKQSREKAEKREKILEIIARKQDEKLEGLALEELEKMVQAL